ncbi:MAG: T9SS type A sorting domain-containing protein [Crocinitomicaceae bacterium]
MKRILRNLLLIHCGFLIMAKSFGQTIQIPSTWDLTPGSAYTFLNQQGIHNLKLAFFPLDSVKINYDLASVPTSEASSWWQLDPTHFKMNFDPNGIVFGSYCPDDTMVVEYVISNDTLEMLSISSTCTLASSLLTGSKWKNQASSAGMESIPLKIVCIYPNPAEENLVVQSAESLDINSVRIYSVTGTQLSCKIESVSEKQLSIQVEHLLKGTYFLEVQNQQGKIYKVSFVK